MRLYIAEKPSMAVEIAKCLPGPFVRKDGCIETGEGIVTWAYGHILRLAEPGEYDEKYKKWNQEDLPILPAAWRLQVTDSCRKQFMVIKKLLAAADEIVHAGDPDREGQLLIDEVLDYTATAKPVQRLLLNSLDEKSIKKALESLRNNNEFKSLRDSALARQRADWLVGMNMSRAYTLAARQAGHAVTLPVGRVKTPTLALVVRREREIQQFCPVDYFAIRAYFKHEKGYFTASWIPGDTQPGLDKENRLVDPAMARALQDKLDFVGKEAALTKYETAEQREAPPLPYSLSALQLAAGKQFGYSPKTVLEAAQKLYEQKLTTYPRSDCTYLPKTQLEDAPTIMANLTFGSHPSLKAWANKADLTLRSKAWNDKKITAHHAIIPTTLVCNLNSLNEVEQNLYILIAKAYIAQFYPSYVYEQAIVEVAWAGETFKATGRTVKNLGWRELYQTQVGQEDEEKEEEELLPQMAVNDRVAAIRTTVAKKTTKPPERFTASTLLQAMKEIHKYVQKEALKKQLKDVAGIGTEATRASIIDELINAKLLIENKKRLSPADQAYLLIDNLPDELTYPDTTAVWEAELQAIVQQKADLAGFMDRQAKAVTALCAQSRQQTVPNAQLGEPCPQCGQGNLKLKIGIKGKFWACSQYPACKATYEDKNGKPQTKQYPCPRCQGTLKLRTSAKGKFWGCTHYPACKALYQDARGKPVLLPKTAKREGKV